MSTQVINYQCPACGGPLHFESSSGQLKCDYCGSGFDVAEIEALYAEKEAAAAEASKEAEARAAQDKSAQLGKTGAEGSTEATDAAAAANASTAADAEASQWDTTGLQDDWGRDADGMKSYSCPSCGAELICDATTAVASCPYCGNQSIVPGQFAGTLKPDFIIPFKLDKDDAVKALKNHYGKRRLLPKEFSDKNHIEEVKGVYVPFWMFDGAAKGSVSFEATRVTRRKSFGVETIVTEHFDVRRSGEMTFEMIPADASSKMPDDYMDSIEPFDYSELKPFSLGYLPGFLADKYDVSPEESFSRVDERCQGSFEAAMSKTVTGYNTCTRKDADISLKRGKVHYALLPVWILNTKWNKENYLFVMNGQTGKLVGALPASFKRALCMYLAIALPLIAVGAAIVLFLMR